MKNDTPKAGGIGDSGFLDIHEVFQAPVLLGIAEIELDLEAQAVELDDFVMRLLEVSTEQNYMRLGQCIQIGLDAWA